MADTLERKIHFYKVTGSLPNERGVGRKPNLEEVFSALLPISRDVNRNFVELRGINDEDQYGIWIESEDFPVKVRFGRIRHRGLPLRNSGLELSGLELNGDGLVEITHMVFLDNGIVGVEYNHNAPRTSTLASYIRQQLNKDLFFHKIVNDDIDAIFNTFRGIFSFSIRVRPSILDQYEEKQGLIAGLDSIDSEVGSDVIEVGVKNYQNTGTRRFMDNSAVQALRRIVVGNQTADIVGARLEGEKLNGCREGRNLLQDLFVFTTSVVKLDGYRAVEKEDMYDKLLLVYRENENILIRANTIEYSD